MKAFLYGNSGMTRDDGKLGDSLIVFHKTKEAADVIASQYYGCVPGCVPVEHGDRIDSTFFPAGPIEVEAGAVIVASSYYTVRLGRPE